MKFKKELEELLAQKIGMLSLCDVYSSARDLSISSRLKGEIDILKQVIEKYDTYVANSPKF